MSQVRDEINFSDIAAADRESRDQRKLKEENLEDFKMLRPPEAIM